jgi:hypothetical protein
VSAASLTAGDTIQLTATVRDSAGHVLLSQPVSWSTDDPAVVRVQSNAPPGAHLATARVAAVGQGGTAIIATSGSVSDTTFVTVAGWVLIPYGATGYRFRVLADSIRSGGGFELSTFDDVAAGFADGQAAFGSGFLSCPLDESVHTEWPGLTDLLLRRRFDLPAAAGGVQVRVAIDDAVQVFVNGVDITTTGEPNQLQGGFQQNNGCAERDAFVFSVPDALLHPGSNLLAIRARDVGAVSHVDLRVTAGPNQP